MMDELTNEVVVRRRGWLMALIAVASAALSAGYLWHFSSSGSGLELLVGVVLGCIAVGHGRAWSDARHPLLVADATGVRVRLGSQWTGAPWESVERVEVDPRGRITDGHLAVVVADEPAALVAASRRSRVAAAFNRQWYDSSLVVPYGLTAAVSEPDLAGALSRLADGRASVDILDGSPDEPEPTVEVKPASAAPTAGEADSAAPESSAGPVEPERAAQPVLTGATPVAEQGGSRLRRRLFVARTQTSAAGNGAIATERTAQPLRMAARRAEVTMPARRHDPVAVGSLAMSPQALGDPATTLPEIESLRRSSDTEIAEGSGSGSSGVAGSNGQSGSNVSLIIDATTDMSARAMERVRRPPEPRDASGPTVPRDRGEPPEGPVGPLVIGQHISEARQQLRLSVDDLAERTRIRPYVIESIEADDFSPCGGDFYARGHLRMLARVLGIEAAPLVTLYDEHFSSSPVNARDVFEVELAHGSTGMVRTGPQGANWGALIAAVLVLLLVWGVARFVSERSGPDPSPTEPTQNAAGLGSPGAGNTPLPEPHRVRVQVSAVGGESRVKVWDRFRTVVFRGTLADGTTEVVAGKAPLRVMADNGGVISLWSRGVDLGLVGEPGVRSKQLVHAVPRHRN